MCSSDGEGRGSTEAVDAVMDVLEDLDDVQVEDPDSLREKLHDLILSDFIPCPSEPSNGEIATEADVSPYEPWAVLDLWGATHLVVWADDRPNCWTHPSPSDCEYAASLIAKDVARGLTKALERLAEDGDTQRAEHSWAP